MTDTAFPFAQLSAELVRYPQPAPAAPLPVSEPIDEVDDEITAPSRWRDDLRFFLVCYATAFLIFMLLLG